MTTDYATAVSEMSKLFKAAWEANAAAVIGYIPEIEWYGAESVGKPPRDKVWVRFTTDAVFEEQATLSTCVEEPFQRRYNASGLIFVQLFLPKSVTNAVAQDVGREHLTKPDHNI